VINLLWDVIAAKGFEKDTFFEMAARDIRALPKLEGTVHVNIALIVKFMPNYFFNPAEYPTIPRRDEPKDDTFLWDQGPARGLGQIRFHDFRRAGYSLAVAKPAWPCIGHGGLFAFGLVVHPAIKGVARLICTLKQQKRRRLRLLFS
jgi:hypothetical protein